MDHEVLELTRCAINTAGAAMLIYGGFLLSVEIVGRLRGVPGLGREMHQEVFNALRQLFKPPKER